MRSCWLVASQLLQSLQGLWRWSRYEDSVAHQSRRAADMKPSLIEERCWRQLRKHRLQLQIAQGEKKMKKIKQRTDADFDRYQTFEDTSNGIDEIQTFLIKRVSLQGHSWASMVAYSSSFDCQHLPYDSSPFNRRDMKMWSQFSALHCWSHMRKIG